jgi:hypothetical protein
MWSRSRCPRGYEVNSIEVPLRHPSATTSPRRDTTRADVLPHREPGRCVLRSVDGDALDTVFYGTGEEIPNPYFDPGARTPARTTVPHAHGREGHGSATSACTPVWHKRLLGFCLPGQLDVQRERDVQGE